MIFGGVVKNNFKKLILKSILFAWFVSPVALRSNAENLEKKQAICGLSQAIERWDLNLIEKACSKIPDLTCAERRELLNSIVLKEIEIDRACSAESELKEISYVKFPLVIASLVLIKRLLFHSKDNHINIGVLACFAWFVFANLYNNPKVSEWPIFDGRVPVSIHIKTAVKNIKVLEPIKF